MASSLNNAITEHALRYVDGKAALPEFEDWFVPVLWEVNRSDNQVAIDLASEIHILIAEHSRGDRSSESLREELAEVVRPFVLFAENRYGDPRQLDPSQISQLNAGYGSNRAVAA